MHLLTCLHSSVVLKVTFDPGLPGEISMLLSGVLEGHDVTPSRVQGSRPSPEALAETSFSLLHLSLYVSLSLSLHLSVSPFLSSSLS